MRYPKQNESSPVKVSLTAGVDGVATTFKSQGDQRMEHECPHKYVVRGEPTWIPSYNYHQSSVTAAGMPTLVPTATYRCICCGMTFGYLPGDSVELDEKKLRDARV